MSGNIFPTGDQPIFVFGSNEAGIHGAGAAAHAVKHLGARYGHAVGLCGNTYAIPTKNRQIDLLPLAAIRAYVKDFEDFAGANPNMTFQVTQIGCGLAGKKAEDIAPMFAACPSNCWFDKAWEPYLGPHRNYWGTYP